MRIHFLQNISFESPAYLETAAAKLGFKTSVTDLSIPHIFPAIDDFDALVIMGGPMNIYETQDYPWLNPEKDLIKQSIAQGKRVVGICLGAQLIADCLGAEVIRNPQKEIGWFKVSLDNGAENIPILAGFPQEFTAFHWHGDTFQIPSGAKRIASSEACRNQGFIFGDTVIALQFHLETTLQSMESLLENCKGELVESQFIQSADTIRSEAAAHFDANLKLVDRLFRNLFPK